jgi:Fe-S-cluster containining protein
MNLSLAELVLPAARRSDLGDRMASFYAEADTAIAAHRPVCLNRGACCRFDTFGHRLYVTTIELAWFARGRSGAWKAPGEGGSCPYQEGGLCTAREHRPLGCRVFFCDPAAREWQGPEYEGFLSRLKTLGDELGVEYRYVEWLSALGELSKVMADGGPAGLTLPRPAG